jgi:hypothetical protein
LFQKIFQTKYPSNPISSDSFLRTNLLKVTGASGQGYACILTQ